MIPNGPPEVLSKFFEPPADAGFKGWPLCVLFPSLKSATIAARVPAFGHHPRKRHRCLAPEDAFDDYAVEFNVLKNKVLSGNSERGSGVARRRIEEYLEKKRLRELLQEDVVDDVFQ